MPATGYFNTASHGIPVAGVYEVMHRYLATEAKIGPERAAIEWADEVAKVRANAAGLIGGRADQVGFFSTTSTAWMSLMSHMDLSGKRVLISAHEWHDYYQFLNQRGDATIEILPPLDLKNPDLSQWQDRIDEDVAAICAPMVTSITGLAYPVEKIGALTRPKGCKFIVDAAQSLGQMPVDMAKIGCDALVSTTRKWLRGPRQTAILWINDGWQRQGQGMEAHDQNLALRLGLGVAINHATEIGIENLQQQILTRSNAIRNWARENRLDVVDGRTGSVAISISLQRVDPVMAALNQFEISAKIPDATCFEPLSGVAAKKPHFLRISPHLYTGDADLERLFDALRIGFRLA